MKTSLTKFIPNAVTTRFARQILLTKKSSPTLLFGVGVVGVVASTVLAARATLKLEEVLATSQRKQDMANELINSKHPDYSTSDHKQDIAIIRARTVGSIVKLYAPAVLVGISAIGCLTGAHVTLTRRNIGLTAAYATLEKGFAEYRERVRKEVGDDKEREFRYGYETREIIEQTDTGPQTKQLKTVGPNGHSIYARFFDEYCQDWKRQADYNFLFLRCQQNYANDRLIAYGHLFLNEVYDMLGLPRTTAGAVVGWVISDKGDNYIDFGIFDGNNERARDFVNGREGSILLDFNVDGVIYDKI